jgi:hypothetical protein
MSSRERTRPAPTGQHPQQQTSTHRPAPTRHSARPADQHPADPTRHARRAAHGQQTSTQHTRAARRAPTRHAPRGAHGQQTTQHTSVMLASLASIMMEVSYVLVKGLASNPCRAHSDGAEGGCEDGCSAAPTCMHHAHTTAHHMRTTTCAPPHAHHHMRTTTCTHHCTPPHARARWQQPASSQPAASQRPASGECTQGGSSQPAASARTARSPSTCSAPPAHRWGRSRC